MFLWSPNNFIWHILTKRKEWEKSQFLTKKFPLEKWKFCDFFKSMILWSPNNFIWHILTKRKEWEKSQFLTKKFPLEKCKFCDFFKSMILWSTKAIYLSRTSPDTFFGRFWMKSNNEKDHKFWQQPWANPFKIMQILGIFVNRCLYSPQRLAFYPFYLEGHQTPLFGIFWTKRKNEKNFNSRQKPWANPFGEMQI